MDVIKVIEELLPVSSPFSVDCIKKDEAKQEVHIHISVDKSYCPHQHCGHIHQYYDKTCEHTKLFQYRCFIQCRIPVYKNLQTGKTEALQVYNIDTIWEALIEFYQQTDYQIAQANLTFIADYSTCIFGEKNKLSKSILRHFDGIVQNIKSSITNGVLEGINSKIQTLKRVARGFRYTENFMKMVLFIFGVIEPRIQNTT